jgi:hypothetical protein
MRTIERFDIPRPRDAQSRRRFWIGFFAGFAAVLTFSNGVIAILYAAGAPVPLTPWSMEPVPPFGMPRSLSGAFWGGLWGIVYVLLEPRLTPWLGWWRGGLAFGGVLPLLALWFVVLPVKGVPVGGGFMLPNAFVDVALHAIFGLGTAFFFRLAAPQARGSVLRSSATRALRG